MRRSRQSPQHRARQGLDPYVLQVAEVRQSQESVSDSREEPWPHQQMPSTVLLPKPAPHPIPPIQDVCFVFAHCLYMLTSRPMHKASPCPKRSATRRAFKRAVGQP